MNNEQIIRKLYNNEYLEAGEVKFLASLLSASPEKGPDGDEPPYNHASDNIAKALGFEDDDQMDSVISDCNRRLKKVQEDKNSASQCVEAVEQELMASALSRRAFLYGYGKMYETIMRKKNF